MTARGWSSAGLPVVTDGSRYWTVADAAVLLGPLCRTVEEVRRMVRKAGLQPIGKRRTSPPGTSGRYSRVYAAKDLIEAYEELSQRTYAKAAVPTPAATPVSPSPDRNLCPGCSTTDAP